MGKSIERQLTEEINEYADKLYEKIKRREGVIGVTKHFSKILEEVRKEFAKHPHFKKLRDIE
ncbi:MAG: hypothetical protein N2234_04810, partial [Planctomycetota bacterium]|nr:hypothetical protein [Planctomycetota bacterium]